MTKGTVTIEQFIRLLDDSGLLTAVEMEDVLAGLPLYTSVNSLAEGIYRRGRLTKYQLQRVYQGNGKSLHLGNYTVIDKIGQGGMGLVVKARHRVMQRIVAIKILSANTVRSPDAVRRFHREVEAAARLDHPNIVTAFDADQANGTHFMVMEYVDGHDLSSLIKQHGPLSVTRAMEMLLQVGKGLVFAHSQGVIHRDIKPANLLIDHAGTVRILDLGLARVESSDDLTDITGTGQIMGTIDYMAPEQALNTRTADHRADIYSFGCTLWFLITGKSVFGGDSALAKLLEHREGAIPSLIGTRVDLEPTNLRAVAADEIICKMLAKRPEDRYQSMAEVVTALEDCLAGRLPDSTPSSTARLMGAGNVQPANSLLSFLESDTAADSDTHFDPPDPKGIHFQELKYDPTQATAAVSSFERRIKTTGSSRHRRHKSLPIWLTLGIFIAGGLGLLVGGKRSAPAGPPSRSEVTATVVASSSLPLGAEATIDTTLPTEVVPLAPKHRRSTARVPVTELKSPPLSQMAFNGVDSYVQIDSLVQDSRESYTLEGWIILEGSQAETTCPLMWTGQHSLSIQATERSFGICQNLDKLGESFRSTKQVALDVPVHVAGIWRDGEQTLFVNGRSVPLTRGDSRRMPVSKGGLFIGGSPPDRSSVAQWYRGVIDEVRISQGVRYRMNFAPIRRFPEGDPHTLALYHFDEGHGDTVTDSSGNGHHGKLVNSRWITTP